MNRTLSIVMLLVLCAGVAAAQVDGKNTTVSIGSYAINWSSDVENSEDIKFKGFELGGTIAMSPSMAIRGGYFMTENDDNSDVKINGIKVGSANIDLVTRVPRCPRPGETLIGSSFATVAGWYWLLQCV